MAVRYYDDAICEKLKSWIKKSNIRVLKPNEVTRLFQLQAEDKNDEPLTLPLIAISRDPSINISVATRRSLTCDGLKLDGTRLATVQLEAIPLEIHYQVDIYTQKYEEGDEYLRQFIYGFVNYPKMKVEIPYNGAKIEHVCYLRLANTVTDNSDVAEKLFPDEFTRWTLQLTLNDAYLFSVPVNENGRIIGADLEMVDSNNLESEIEVILTEQDLNN